MKQKNEWVPVEDFNIDTLRKAFLEGRLYIHQAATSENTREESIQAILQYVSRIDASGTLDCKELAQNVYGELIEAFTIID